MTEEKPEPAAQTENNQEEERPKRARRAIPKFELANLQDPEKGLSYFWQKCERLPDTSLAGDRESLSLLMRMYQHWLYRLFPADFGDMCWKIADRKGVKAYVRNFTFDVRGIDAAFGTNEDSDLNDDGELPPAPQMPPQNADEPSIPGIMDLELPQREEPKAEEE